MAEAKPIKRAHNFKDLSGSYGCWTVMWFNSTRNKKAWWWCLCDPVLGGCGTQRAVLAGSLLNGKSTNCGCKRKDGIRAAVQTHGMSRSVEHNLWMNMLQRCYNPDNPAYIRYGGRGIGVCERWRESFENFYADMGSKPSAQHTLERKVNDAWYTPTNCVWATRIQQARNTRRNRMVLYLGRTQSLAAWAEELGMSYTMLRHRLRLGWSVERAFQTVPRLRVK